MKLYVKHSRSLNIM